VSLRPDAAVQKALVSTPSRMVGEYDGGGILVTHAWPDFHDGRAFRRMIRGTGSRSCYIYAFETPPIEAKAGTRLPDYSSAGPIISSYLSLLFGKRFDPHGLIEHAGFFCVPDLAGLRICLRHGPSIGGFSASFRPRAGSTPEAFRVQNVIRRWLICIW
jgi:hypothetical protein